jgi:hypothetical protein
MLNMIGLGLGIWQSSASRFNPLSLSFSPLAWWDWSDGSQIYTDSNLTTLVSADGDPIGGVKDKSTSGYNLTQTDGAAKGLHKKNINNGLSVGRTDGVNDFWQVAGSESFFKCLHYEGATVFFAGKSGTTNNANVQYAIFGNSSDSILVGYSFAYLYDNGSNISQPSVYVSKGSGSALISTAGKTNFNGMFPSNTPVLLTQKIDPQNATVANRAVVYRGNGVGITGNTSTGAASNSNSTYPLVVGAAVINGNVKVAYGPNDYYEIIIYPTLLSDANRTLVTNYLLSKWAVT